MNLAHQHIVRRLNAQHHNHRLRWVLLALVVGAWWGYCLATPGHAEQIAQTHVPYVMGAPGTTLADWREGTYSDSAPELDIDIRRIGGRHGH
jgi:hypothetical protein